MRQIHWELYSYRAVQALKVLYLCLTRYKLIFHPVKTLKHCFLLKPKANSIFIPTSIACSQMGRTAFVRMSDQRQSWPLHCRRSQNGDCRRKREPQHEVILFCQSCCPLTSFNHSLSLNTKAIYGLFSE